MKKWIKCFIAVCVAALMSAMLAGCGKTAGSGLEPDLDARLKSGAGEAVSQVILMSDAQVDAYIDQFNSEQNTVYANGFNSWKNEKKELGSFDHYESAEVTQTSKGYTVTIIAAFEKRKCEIIYGVNARLDDINELAFNPVYSLSEKMGQAGINLVIGMGTVFAVLIFLTWVISLFKYINKAQTRMEAGRKTDSQQPKPEEEPDVQLSAAAAPDTQDEELQAVIAAAIAAYEADSEPGIDKQESLNNGLFVRSFKRGGDR